MCPTCSRLEYISTMCCSCRSAAARAGPAAAAPAGSVYASRSVP